MRSRVTAFPRGPVAILYHVKVTNIRVADA
jgi:hypothetical protein